MRKIDLTGQRFGRLTVIEEADHSHDGRVRWLCKCDCGNFTSTPSTKTLRNGTCRSCGCIEVKKPNAKTHGMTYKVKLYGVWNGMKQRCGNQNGKSYKNYGGRGIRVCQEWADDFKAFYTWAMANGYQEGLTIDRIDNDGDYTPNNCQWLTLEENVSKARKSQK